MEDKFSQETVASTAPSLSQLSSSNLEEDSLIIKDFNEISICYDSTSTSTPTTSSKTLESSTKDKTNITRVHNIIWGKSKASEYKTAYYNARTKVAWTPYNKTKFTALSKLSSEEKQSNASWLKNREIMLQVKAERLKQLEKERNPDQLTDYEKLKLTLKTTLKAIKKWEQKFFEKLGKKPSKEEIDKLPKVKAMYVQFQSLSKKVKEIEANNPELVANKSKFINQSMVSGINQSIFNTTLGNVSRLGGVNNSILDMSILNNSRLDRSMLNNNASIMDITLPITSSNPDNSIIAENSKNFEQPSSKLITPPEVNEAANMSMLDQSVSFMDNSILNTSRLDNSILAPSNISFSNGLKIKGPPKPSEVELNLPFKSPSSQTQSQSPSDKNHEEEVLINPDNEKLSQQYDIPSDIPTSDIWEFDLPSSQRSVIPEDHPLNKVYTSSPYYYDNLQSNPSENNEHLDNWLLTTETLMQKYFPNIEEEIKIELNNPTIKLTEPLAPKNPLFHVIPGYHASTRRLRSGLSSEIFDDQRDYSLIVEPYCDWEDEVTSDQGLSQDPQLEEFNKQAEDEENAINQNKKSSTSTRTRVNRGEKPALTKKDLVSDNFVKLNTRNNRYKPKLQSGRAGTSRFSRNYFKK